MILVFIIGDKLYLPMTGFQYFFYRITPYLNQRFVTGFNSSAVQMISINGNHFVLVNSMALEGDGCFLCRAAEVQLQQIASMYNVSCSYNLLNSKHIF